MDVLTTADIQSEDGFNQQMQLSMIRKYTQLNMIRQYPQLNMIRKDTQLNMIRKYPYKDEA